MKRLREELSSGKFVITCEFSPPKGTDLGPTLEKVKKLKNKIVAINMTDNNRAVMRMSPLGACVALLQERVDPIMQITCRDRNRMAIQSDLLAASALGIKNILTLWGDPIKNGDHPDGKEVYDLNSAGDLLNVIAKLNSGKDLMGNALEGKTDLFPGAAADPGAPLDKHIPGMEKKIEAGARFFQTQAFYQFDKFERFMEKAAPLKVPIIGGIILLKSVKMANFINQNLPGVKVPEALIKELEGATDPLRKGMEIAARQIQFLKGLCQGAHLMTIGREDLVGEILTIAESL
ncbi:MAG: methylenetetrahydrofolate reductase [Deltaproteobacteria bacterium]|nr:methylenetetrahydrofolate reductase [Deltaproteobacteria bacterium]